MTAVHKKARSPYQRHAKRPHRYSAELVEWAAAVKRGDGRAARDADDRWRAMMKRTQAPVTRRGANPAPRQGADPAQHQGADPAPNNHRAQPPLIRKAA